MDRPFSFLRKSLLSAAIVSIFSAPVSAGTEDAVKHILPEYLKYLTLPNVAKESPSDIKAVAEWTRDTYRKHGLNAKLLPDGQTPMVYAEYMEAGEDAPVVLFYAHMDGQPVNPEQWDQESPWRPVLKTLEGDSWQSKPMTALTFTTDPEWRIFARSASDDKGPIMMLLAAIDTLKAENKKPAVNIKVLLDSHEEGGPPTLIDVINRNKNQLQADGVVMLDGPMHPSNRPTLVFGHRGASMVRLTVFGPASDSHSGHYGNYAANPAFLLADLLGKMKDDDGRVTIPGYYDAVKFDDDYASALDAVPADEAALMKRLGIATTEKVAGNYQRAINYPSLNINGLSAASTEATRTIIPATATVTMDIRTTKTATAERQIKLVKDFVIAQGYHLVEDAPTAKERSEYPRIARFISHTGTAALQTPLDEPLGQWALTALSHVSDSEPVIIPMMGGTVPTSPLVSGLQKPVILLPLVNADNNQHAPNENLRLGNFFSGTETLYQMFTTPLMQD